MPSTSSSPRLQSPLIHFCRFPPSMFSPECPGGPRKVLPSLVLSFEDVGRNGRWRKGSRSASQLELEPLLTTGPRSAIGAAAAAGAAAVGADDAAGEVADAPKSWSWAFVWAELPCDPPSCGPGPVRAVSHHPCLCLGACGQLGWAQIPGTNLGGGRTGG